MCPLYECKRSLPQKVTGFWAAQRVLLFYFLNLSRADLWLENTVAFCSFCFLTFSIFILVSTVFLITSWGGKQVKIDEPNTADAAERSLSDCISHQYLIFWISYPLVLISHLFLAPFNTTGRATPFCLILGNKLFFGQWVKALGRQKMHLKAVNTIKLSRPRSKDLYLEILLDVCQSRCSH